MTDNLEFGVIGGLLAEDLLFAEVKAQALGRLATVEISTDRAPTIFTTMSPDSERNRTDFGEV